MITPRLRTSSEDEVVEPSMVIHRSPSMVIVKRRGPNTEALGHIVVDRGEGIGTVCMGHKLVPVREE